MKPARNDPARLEGRPFSLRDLQVALLWAEKTPTMRLRIMLDHPNIAEVIEVCPPLFAYPRWFIWNTFDGRLRVDDLSTAEFGLPYLTVNTALRFIESTLLLD